MEVKNIDSLLDDLKFLREGWPIILSEAKLVANEVGIIAEFPQKRKIKRKRFVDETTTEEIHEGDESESSEENNFKREVFYKLIDSVIAGLKRRYTAARQINSLSSFFWQCVIFILQVTKFHTHGTQFN